MQLFSQAFQELVPATAGLPNFVFFHEIHGFIDDELIHEYLPNLGQRVLRVLGGAGVLVLTLWIMVQGVRIVTGQSRESMMTLVVNALRATFIVDPQNVIRFVSVNDLSVGRNPSEVLRVLDALQTDKLCPCNWKKGEKTLN